MLTWYNLTICCDFKKVMLICWIVANMSTREYVGMVAFLLFIHAIDKESINEVLRVLPIYFLPMFFYRLHRLKNQIIRSLLICSDTWVKINSALKTPIIVSESDNASIINPNHNQPLFVYKNISLPYHKISKDESMMDAVPYSAPTSPSSLHC